MKNTIVSKFKNYKDTVPVNISIWEWLHDNTFKETVQKIRTLTDKDKIRELKAQLPCITPSGTFTSRSANNLVNHSGYICIDIDSADNAHITNFEGLRDELRKIKNIAYAALSVSGKGVFCLIPIRHKDKHKEHFEALKIQFSNINIIIDKACADISRLRGYSYDENAYFNETPIVFNQVLEYKPQKNYEIRNIILKKPFDNEKKTHLKVIKLIEKVKYTGIDITEKYEQWFQIACALANEFGEEGRDMFHAVSANHLKYNDETCDNLFSACLTNSYDYTIGTFFHWTEKYGLL